MEIAREIDKGPDQYAGQVFPDHLGRALLVSWIPGWKYQGFVERDVGCLSIYEGEISDLKILRDGYVMEVFVNGGQEVYTALL